MEREVSKKTLFVLITIAVVLAIVSTAVGIMTLEKLQSLSLKAGSKVSSVGGKVILKVPDKSAEPSLGSGQVTFTVKREV